VRRCPNSDNVGYSQIYWIAFEWFSHLAQYMRVIRKTRDRPTRVRMITLPQHTAAAEQSLGP
ncbi:hypothetical protein, partial [Mesorhizobium sp. M00.F.Ca.ET.220.01.1.1]|uniref:hypothetical protein n=1 Tax=Mesorhizobium sp. M00.F.Ca.ET.220.01.1.1 TaxID=2500531 RepID=UPI001AEDDBE5